MSHWTLRCALAALSISLLLSCGGGGGGGGFAAGAGSTGAGAPVASGSATESQASADGTATSGSGAATSGSGAATGSTSTAAAGDDSGVGSGGTGVSVGSAGADAVGVGAIGGLGSIIVNGVRYGTAKATVTIEDADALQIGITARVAGPVDADFTAGEAREVSSAAELRGLVLAVEAVQRRLSMPGATVLTDESTVWADLPGIDAVRTGMSLQVWGLPATPGVLRATRVEQRPAGAPIVTGTVANLNTALRTFTLGTLVIDYRAAAFAAGLDAASLANGTIVRVRATVQPAAGTLAAALVAPWNPLPRTDGARLQLGGAIADFAAPSTFTLLGVRVDASAARIMGGPAGSLGNGVKVEVGGTLAGGVLRASTLRIRQVPGTGGPASFTVIGPVGNFQSAARFRVRGQPVDASGPDVSYSNGTAADLGNGVRVTVSGTQVVDGVLIASSVRFD